MTDVTGIVQMTDVSGIVQMDHLFTGKVTNNLTDVGALPQLS